MYYDVFGVFSVYLILLLTQIRFGVVSKTNINITIEYHEKVMFSQKNHFLYTPKRAACVLRIQFSH